MELFYENMASGSLLMLQWMAIHLCHMIIHIINLSQGFVNNREIKNKKIPRSREGCSGGTRGS